MNARTLRAAVAAVAIVIVAAVVLALRRPTPAALPTPATGGRAASETRSEGVVIHNYREGQERWSLTAAGMAGKEGEATRLKQVSFVSTYLSQGEQGTVTIKADECVYTESIQKAVFKGNVKVTTADGLEIDTDTLTYRGDKGIAKTDDPARFRRKDVAGSSTGAEFEAETGRVALPADVQFRIANDQGPPAEIRSNRAVAFRERGTLRFDEDVSVVQGKDTLKTAQLTLSFDSDTHLVQRALAIGSVELRTSGAGLLPGTSGGPAAKSGPRILKSRKLNIGFRPDHTMDAAVASGDAELTILPVPGGKQERRTLTGRILRFEFDEQGRVQRVKGQKQTALVVQPMAKGADAQTVRANRFLGKLEPATGELRTVAFRNAVSFSRGAQQATAEKALYTGNDQRLRLTRRPKIDQDGNQLTAESIDLATQSGDVKAAKNVHHLLRRRNDASRTGLLSGKDAPTLLTCARFRYEAKSRTARYEDSALLRSGKDEVRAPALIVEEDAKGNRKLTGSKGVVSLLNPAANKPGEKTPAALEARAEGMVYDEAAGHITYTGDVAIRQGDIATKSPKAVMTLTPDGGGIEKLVAGEPVAVQQADRRATGKEGVYTPGNETVILTGESVVLIDKAGRTEGRSLTFRVGDDRILVEGREEGRTETILKKESPPP